MSNGVDHDNSTTRQLTKQDCDAVMLSLQQHKQKQPIGQAE